MTLYKLIIKEIWYRKFGFFLSILSVAIAVACPIGLSYIIKAYQFQRDKMFESAFREKERMLKEAEDKYRIATKKFGYNVLILPKAQNIEDFYADDYSAKTMPEDYVRKLANSGILSVRHFLPSLKQKVRWPEAKRTIIVFGVSGEVPNVYKKPREPMMSPIKRGQAVLGYYIHTKMKLKVGDKIKLLGRVFTVKKLMPERGNKDDITVWINLRDAQEILDRPGQINAILALQCVCSGSDFDIVRKNIKSVLPDTQVLGIEIRKIKSRAEIRKTAALLTQRALGKELQDREQQIQTLRRFMNIVSPIIILTSALWISFLALNNIRARRYEIGLFLALGITVKRILYIFIAKAFCIGLIGSAIGYCIGYIFGVIFGINLFNPKSFLTVSLVSSFLTVLASLPPIISSITRQPADILRTE